MSSRPSFNHLSEAITWIEQQLDSNVDDPFPCANVLKEIHHAQALHLLYQGKDFPAGADSFKLGGHAKELGHMHIDFKKENGVWWLQEIWQCR